MTALILNFSHPLTPRQQQDLGERFGPAEERRIPVHVPDGQSLKDAARGLLDRADLTSEEWQTRPLLLIVPGLAPLTACLLADLHGRCGYFPGLVVIRPDPEGIPGTFHVSETVNLQEIRQGSRSRRDEPV
ncbi:CRISPR-associated protein Csx15 [Deinococcus marmoris]|uniref:CRISPR-associated protein Csx15 n=1 Tax=Deinococcus marmoris TaxID=249408 RepID=UPI00049576B1|nr:CRISPR-associated protein Csx15 [Deinococcus marmoris]